MSGGTGKPLRAALLALVVGLGGCASAFTSALTSTPARLYTLTPGAPVDPTLPQVGWQLLVETPVAPAGLDTPRIAVARTPTSIDYFADVSWTDRAPNMVQGVLIESFEDSGKIVSVGRDTAALRSDFVLKTDLRDFQAEYTSPGAANPDRVRVRIAAKLVAMPRRTIEAGETFEAVAPVQGGGFAPVVEAFDTALRQVMGQMVAWALRKGAAVRPAGAG
ncbi:MAG TPA: ABC-type transport auxiliary lipoprotein family protein [Azospirillum sp.]|nr:ABC-type transport auxiliary lipoprotein family protein [Azospirillum sp.]